MEAELLERHGVPGAAVARVEHGEVLWTRGFGVADTELETPVGEETAFRASAAAPPLTAWAVLRLVEEGRIELGDPVSRHLPGLRAAGWEAVTVEGLLSHTAGVEPRASGGGPPELAAAPGSGFRYSPAGYRLLRSLVEEVTGEPFPSYLRGAVLGPLGMSRTGYRREDLAEVAVGHDGEGRSVPEDPGEPAPFASAGDLARLMAALTPGLDGESPGRRVLAPETVELMLTPMVRVEDDYRLTEAYGFGHWVDPLPDGGRLAYHSGASPGWRSLVAALPEMGRGIVILTNGDNGDELIAELAGMWTAWATA